MKIADEMYEKAIAEYIHGLGFDEHWLSCHLCMIVDHLDKLTESANASGHPRAAKENANE